MRAVSYVNLTFFEFLFKQSGVDGVMSPEAATSGTNAVLLGFAGLQRLLVIRRASVVGNAACLAEINGQVSGQLLPI